MSLKQLYKLDHFLANATGSNAPPWVIMKGADYQKGFSPIIKGLDQMDCVLALPSDRPLEQALTTLPYVNVNSSKLSKTNLELSDDVYLYVAGYHNFSKPTRYRAFFIMRYPAELPTFKSMEQAYLSPLREGLVTTTGFKDGYYNFHRSNINSDGSLGCWTLDSADFDNFRAQYKDLQVGVVVKSTTSAGLGYEAIKRIRRSYE